MSDYNELVTLLQELLLNKFSPKPSFTRGILGDGLGNVIVPERPDKSYVRFNRGAGEFFEVFNRTVNPVEGWPVLIGELPWQPGLTQVVDTDWSAFEQSGWGDNIGATSPHAPTHEWPDKSAGSDPVNVYTRSIVPLRSYANSTGTFIFVNSYEYEYQGSGHVWGGTPSLDLSPVISSMASGTMRYMGVYLEPETNTIGIVTGETTIFTSAFDPPRVQFPENVIPSARVRVYGSQANVSDADITDARQPFGVANWWNAGGDLTGSYPNPQVSGLFGYPLEGGTPSEGDIWMFSGSSWQHLPFGDVGGAGAWPGTGKAKIDETEYATFAAALAAIGVSGTIKLGDGVFPESVTITTDCNIVGTGKEATIIISDEVATVNTRASVNFENLTIKNTRIDFVGIGSPTALNVNSANITEGDVTAFNCKFLVNANSPDDARAVRFNVTGTNHRLLECDGEAINASGTADAISFGDGNLEIRGGTWDGKTNDIQAYSTADNLILNDPIFANSLVTIDSAVSANGRYFDSLRNVYTISSDIFPYEDEQGIYSRWSLSKVVVDEFSGSSLDAAWSWATYAGFATPDVVSFADPSKIRLGFGNTQSGLYGFMYRTIASINESYRAMITPIAFAPGQLIGARVDDGTLNNYSESFLRWNGTNWELASRYVIGGGGPVTSIKKVSSTFATTFIVSLQVYGTTWTNWGTTAQIGINSEAFDSYLIVGGLTYTATRIGILTMNPTATPQTFQYSRIDKWMTGF